MEKDVLNRIKWDPKLKAKEFEIHYLDRFTQRLSRINFSEIEVEGDFFRHGDSVIPMHRIRKITRKEAVIWQNRRN